METKKTVGENTFFVAPVNGKRYVTSVLSVTDFYGENVYLTSRFDEKDGYLLQDIEW